MLLSPARRQDKAIGNILGADSLADIVLGDETAPPMQKFSAAAFRRKSSAASIDSINVAQMLASLDRRNKSHAEIIRLVHQRAQRAGLRTEFSTLVDLFVDGRLMIEVKSINGDHSRQVRAALAQLYHYRFLYRDKYKETELMAVFGAALSDELRDFLADCNIACCWLNPEGNVVGSARARSLAPWLVDGPTECGVV